MATHNLTITPDSPDVQAEIRLLSSEGGIDIYRVNITRPENAESTPVTVTWREEFLNTLYTWFPTCKKDLGIHQWFGPRESFSCFHFGAPIFSAIGAEGRNNVTVSVSDVSTPITMSHAAFNRERGENIAEYRVQFFDRLCSWPENYTADIRIDRRPIPYYEAIMSVYPWWTEYGHEIPACPPAAEYPLYSTWYSCCQKPRGTELLEDLEAAAKAGLRTIILDDGWQIPNDSDGGYGFCGEWVPATDKFPDFKAFTDGVHALGMKLLIWISVPFIGWNTKLHEKFKGMYLSDDPWQKCSCLDPRFPEARRHIIDSCKRILRDYDVDGFKLDFVGSFQPEAETLPYDGNVMDCVSTEDGVKLLLEALTTELAEIKPDLLYEFRQNYIGPAINGFANMLRVGDCAYDVIANRVGMVNLRLLGYPTAIHSDMLCWSTVEDSKICAKHLLNILFCVPQISIFFTDCTEEQNRLLRHYLEYWTSNRHILLHGKFRPLHPEHHFTVISAEGEDKIIAVLHDDTPYTYEGKACDVHLNGNCDSMIFENPTDKVLAGEIYDRFGTLLETVEIPAYTCLRLPVPETGMLRVL